MKTQMRHFSGMFYIYLMMYNLESLTEKKQEVYEECVERKNVQCVVLCVWVVYGASNLALFFSYPFCVMSPKKTETGNYLTHKH